MTLPVEHLHRYYEGLVTDDPAAKAYALSLWSEDCILHIPGANRFSGAHKGKEWMAQEYVPALAVRDTLRQKEECFSLVGDDRYGLSHYRETFAIPGAETLVAMRHALYEFENDLIVSIRVFEEDEAAADRFFNTYFPVEPA
ncbi:nuclear transport factor 2 family protein [Aeromicrobium wangtongii]|uniref:nuclear transport factor 2 family protein n=1 Tax=Aeromicrobium wangtongii TaxID=2969247 RepID=UPI00201724D5|nr:nuclear transport factor 2 family protein [Aeromicrobium wangtongii]MCL3816949.1 nuclear transport factor 2 family protein [Aeromicrobium wangtongii]